MSFYTGDPIADFHRHDAEQESRRKELPICSDCGHEIQDEYYNEFDCYFYCDDCLVTHHRKRVEDYVS